MHVYKADLKVKYKYTLRLKMAFPPLPPPCLQVPDQLPPGRQAGEEGDHRADRSLEAPAAGRCGGGGIRREAKDVQEE